MSMQPTLRLRQSTIEDKGKDGFHLTRCKLAAVTGYDFYVEEPEFKPYYATTELGVAQVLHIMAHKGRWEYIVECPNGVLYITSKAEGLPVTDPRHPEYVDVDKLIEERKKLEALLKEINEKLNNNL